MPSQKKKAFSRAPGLFSFAFLLFSCASVPEAKSKIVLACPPEVAKDMKVLLSSFSSAYPDLQVETKVYEDDVLAYLLRHDALDADLIAFSDLLNVYRVGGKLYDFRNTDPLSRFNTYCSAFLSDETGAVNCLPSPGSVFSYVVNEDLLASKNLETPKTVYDLSTLAKNFASSNYSSFASSWEKERLPLDVFMQSCLPSYFASTQGNEAFNSFFFGTEPLASSPSLSSLLSFVNEFSKLYTHGFADSSLTAQAGEDAFLSGQAALLSLPPRADLIDEFSARAPSFSWSVHPYLGSTATDSLIPATCDFYLCASKSSMADLELRPNLWKFLDFFSTSDGQLCLALKESGKVPFYVFSHLKNATFNLVDGYDALNKAFRSGRIYLVDKFVGAFSQCLTSLTKLSQEEVSSYGFVSSLDQEMSSIREKAKTEYSCASLMGEGGLNSRYEVSQRVADLIRADLKADALALPSSFLKQEIVDETLLENDMKAVFDQTCSLLPAWVNGKEFIELLSSLSEPRGLGVSLSGVKRSGETFVLESGSSIKENASYFLYLPSSALEGSALPQYIQGSPVLAFDEICKILKKGETR